MRASKNGYDNESDIYMIIFNSGNLQYSSIHHWVQGLCCWYANKKRKRHSPGWWPDHKPKTQSLWYTAPRTPRTDCPKSCFSSFIKCVTDGICPVFVLNSSRLRQSSYQLHLEVFWFYISPVTVKSTSTHLFNSPAQNCPPVTSLDLWPLAWVCCSHHPQWQKRETCVTDYCFFCPLLLTVIRLLGRL